MFSTTHVNLSRSETSYVHGVYKSSDVLKMCFSSAHTSRNVSDERSTPGAIWLSWRFQECPGETVRFQSLEWFAMLSNSRRTCKEPPAGTGTAPACVTGKRGKLFAPVPDAVSPVRMRMSRKNTTKSDPQVKRLRMSRARWCELKRYNENQYIIVWIWELSNMEIPL